MCAYESEMGGSFLEGETVKEAPCTRTKPTSFILISHFYFSWQRARPHYRMIFFPSENLLKQNGV